MISYYYYLWLSRYVTKQIFLKVIFAISLLFVYFLKAVIWSRILKTKPLWSRSTDESTTQISKIVCPSFRISHNLWHPDHSGQDDVKTSKQPTQSKLQREEPGLKLLVDAAENDSWVFVVGREGGTPGSSREHTSDDGSNVFKGTVGTGPMFQTEICSLSRVLLGYDHLRSSRKDVCVPSSFKVSYCSLRSQFSSCRAGPGYLALQRWQRQCERQQRQL